jgi:hypothetical protein
MRQQPSRGKKRIPIITAASANPHGRSPGRPRSPPDALFWSTAQIDARLGLSSDVECQVSDSVRERLMPKQPSALPICTFVLRFWGAPSPYGLCCRERLSP